MDPTSSRLLAFSGDAATVLATMQWVGTNDTSVSITSPNYTVLGDSNGRQTYSNQLPGITTNGYFVDIELNTGFNSSPTRVAWLGVCNTNESFTSSTRTAYTGWYWSGSVWYPSTSENIGSALNAGIYRIAARNEAGVPKIYFQKSGEVVRGPYPAPIGSLRLMMLGQGGFPLPQAVILNSGALYEGGGGLFGSAP